jgi:hypothetical protein
MEINDRVCISEFYNVIRIFCNKNGEYHNNISLYDFFCRHAPVIVISKYQPGIRLHYYIVK